MTPQEYLLELGYTAEDATTLLADEKFAKPITAALGRYEEASTLSKQAQEQKQALDKWWKEEAQPALLNADGGSAAAKAEAARYRTYMQEFVDKGYPVSDEIKNSLKGTVTPVNPTPANPVPQFDPQKFQSQIGNETADAMVHLYDLGEEYRELYGGRMPNSAALLAEARQANKPLTEYVRTKFNFEGKRTEIADKKIQDRIAAAQKETEERVRAEEAAKRNPNLAPAITSRSAEIKAALGDKKDSWKTKVGRNEAKADRLVQFRQVASKIA